MVIPTITTRPQPQHLAPRDHDWTSMELARMPDTDRFLGVYPDLRLPILWILPGVPAIGFNIPLCSHGSHPPAGVNMTPLREIQCTEEERENVASLVGYPGREPNIPYEGREAEDARGDSGGNLSIRESAGLQGPPRQPSSAPTSRVGKGYKLNEQE